ncbi:MAG TPA: PHB depolymerase family esterase [Actinoplanes sp.]|nr:PHB depolymerase family esterase [Actinoplanes sp.]
MSADTSGRDGTAPPEYTTRPTGHGPANGLPQDHVPVAAASSTAARAGRAGESVQPADPFPTVRSNAAAAPARSAPGSGPLLDCSYTGAAGTRRYRLYLPSGYTGQPVPLIVMLHGGTQSGADFAAAIDMNAHADWHTFLVAYPEQSSSANSMRFWNWFRPEDQRRDSGEPSLIAGITRQISADHAVDPARIYVAGFSAGGAMAAVMAATYPDLYAAVGVHSGLAHRTARDTMSAFAAMSNGPSTAHPSHLPTIPIMVIHGDHDPTVHHLNADHLIETALRANGDRHTQHRIHTTDSRVPGGRRYTHTTYTDDAAVPIVERLTIHQGGHAWSGGPPGPHTDPLGPDASAELVRFFHQHHHESHVRRTAHQDTTPAGTPSRSETAEQVAAQRTPMTVLTGRSRSNRTPASAVVVNPSEVGDLGRLRRTVDDTLSRAGWPAPRWFETTADDPGLGQTRAAVDAGAEVVLVCGGDATVISAVSALVGTDTAMAILPAGTGSLLAANLGLSTDLPAGLQVVLDGGRRRLDVGAVGGRHFVVMAGMGVDAHMREATSTTARSRIGGAADLLGAVRHRTDRPMRVSIRIDDGAPMRRRARSVLIANGGRLQGGVRLVRQAVPDDALFDIAVLTARTLRNWAALGWGLIRGSARVPSMEVFRGAKVEVISNRPQPRQLDGDLIDPGDRLLAEVIPGALWLCVPQPADAPDLADDATTTKRRAAALITEAK